jgi:serine/threonine-protein kinase
MGHVYLAEDPNTSSAVALKLIDIGTDQDSREVVEAEKRGAALHARLCGVDLRVAQIHEVGELDGFFYIVMEYVDGRDLSEVLTEGPLDTRRAVDIAIVLCEVLATAHGFEAALGGEQYHGIVHGDIKPRNIRLTTSGGVKILDFGIAKALSLTRSFTRNVFGSIPYASPERLNTGEVDEASDVWSIGVVLYEMLQGRPYFGDENSARVEHAIRSYSALSASLLEIPMGLRQILGKALAPDPAMRYPSADALRRDLVAFREGKPLSVEAELGMHSNGADPDATRRTVAPSFDDAGDAPTRRTTAPARAAPPHPDPGSVLRSYRSGVLERVVCLA